MFGGLDDWRFDVPTSELFRAFREGRAILVISRLTLGELEAEPERVRTLSEAVPEANMEVLAASAGAEALADAYIETGLMEPRSRSDALHIALASAAGVDPLSRWDFTHMTWSGRLDAFNRVNRRFGHSDILITDPAHRSCVV